MIEYNAEVDGLINNRNKKFLKMMGSLSGEFEGASNVKLANMKGMPACMVNQGWLKDKMTEMIQNKASKFDCEAFIIHNIQRVKHLKISRCGKEIRFEFWTKDDFGYYEYAFHVTDTKAIIDIEKFCEEKEQVKNG